MNSRSGGQNSHNAGNDRKPKLARTWLDVEPDRLWWFASDEVAEHGLREVAKIAGLSKETVRKFIGRIGDPKIATRKALGELFLRKHAGGAMADPTSDDLQPELPPLRKLLIELLPRGEKEARATLSLIFGLARRVPNEVPPAMLDAIERWMQLQVEGEYDWERFHAQLPKRKRKPRSGTATRGRATGPKPEEGEEPHRRKRKAEDGGGDED
jgi:hypothetical protein